MSAQSAEQRFRSITTIIKDLRIAGLWVEEGTGWDRAKLNKDHLNKKDTQMLDSLSNLPSGAELVIAKSSPCVLATNSKELRFQAREVSIEPLSDRKEVLTFLLEHVRRFKNYKENISFKDHARIVISFLRRIYEEQDETQLAKIQGLLTCYVLGMSLPKKIDRLFTKKAGLPPCIELFRTPFRKEVVGNMSSAFRVEDEHVTNFLHWAGNLLKTNESYTYYNAALEQLKVANSSSMKFTEEIAAAMHDILHIVLKRPFNLEMVRLDQRTLPSVIQAQLYLLALLSNLKPFVETYLHVVDPEKVNQPLVDEDTSSAIIGPVEEEELSDSEEGEEFDEFKAMKDGHKPWGGIYFYLLRRIALISTSTFQISSPSNAHTAPNRLLKSSSVTAIEPGHRDMKMGHWEGTIDYLLKDAPNVNRQILKDNLKKVVCKTYSHLVLTNIKKRDSTKPNFEDTLKFSGAYHCELALIALLVRAKSDVPRPSDETSMKQSRPSQKVESVKLGLSKPCCLICNFVICRICEDDILRSVSYSGHHSRVYPCTLPDNLPEAVLSETRLWVEELLVGHLISRKFQDQLNVHLKSLYLATRSTASKEKNASISSEVKNVRVFIYPEEFFNCND